MSSKRVHMIILGVILVVTLACFAPWNIPTSPGPTKEPDASSYYTTTAGTYSYRWWYPFQGSKHTGACTGQATIEMIIWFATEEIYLNANYPKFNQDDCSEADGMAGMSFSGSMQFYGSQYVRWDTCGSGSDWQASGTAVKYDDLFRGGATCDYGDAKDGSTYSFAFTLYYRGEFKP